MSEIQRWTRTSDGKTIEFKIEINKQGIINVLAKKALRRKSLKATSMHGAIKITGKVV